MHGLDELREHGGMTWIEDERGWGAAPDDIVGALTKDGFEACNPETTPGRPELRPAAGGVWQGVNTRTGAVASATWVQRPPGPRPIVFITIDGESVTDRGVLGREPNPSAEDGGEA